MVTRFINGLNNAVGITESTDSDAIGISVGTLKTDGVLLQIFDNDQNLITLAGDVYGSNVTTIRTVEDFGTPVGGEINVTGKAFLLLEPVTCPHTLVGDDFSFKDPSLGLNVLTITADPAIKSTSMVGIQMKDIVLEGSGSNTLFDLTSTGGGNELLSISWSTIGSITKPFASLGTITNVTLVLHQTVVLGFSTGLTHVGGGSSFISAVSFFALANTTINSLSGTFLRATTMQDIGTTLIAGGFVMKLDSAIVFRGARITDISDVGSTAIFDPAGIDQTDPRVLVIGTDAENSFYVGEMAFTGNATVTTISTVNTFTDIAGTTSAATLNERFTHGTSPNVLIYIGIETIKSAVHFAGSADKTGSSKIFGFALFQDTGSGFAMVNNSEIKTEITSRLTSFSNTFTVELKTNDKIKVMTENTEDTDDITVDSFIVSINA